MMEKNNTFVCDKCGECCKHFNSNNDPLKLNRGDGVCRFLKDDLCTIYEKRPMICNVEEGYNHFFKNHMSWEEYLKLNYAACKMYKEGD